MKIILCILLFYTGFAGCKENVLHNKWLLEKIGNTAINPAEYNQVPVFELDLTKNQITGNDGCNSLNGKIEVQRNRIKFHAIVRTEMGCMKKDIGNIIGAQISDKTVDYFLKDGKLFLNLSGDSLLVFKRPHS